METIYGSQDMYMYQIWNIGITNIMPKSKMIYTSRVIIIGAWYRWNQGGIKTYTYLGLKESRY